MRTTPSCLRWAPAGIATAAVLAVLAAACSPDNDSPTGVDRASPAADAVTAAATGYTIKNLGTLGGVSSAAYGVNNVGGVVGSSASATGHQRAFLWRGGVGMKDLGGLAGGESEARAINDDNVVVGYSTLANGAMRAVRWQNGKITNLGSLGGQNSMAAAINDVGVIVGFSEVRNGDRHAFIWQSGVGMKGLPGLGGHITQATGINHAGKIVGWSETAAGVRHVVAWKNGVISDLGTHRHADGVATAVNNPGQIAGSLGNAPDEFSKDEGFPFIFLSGTWTVLSTRQIFSLANAINNAGVMVGYDADFEDADADEDAWVRAADGTLGYLPELTPNGHEQAHGINKFGTIVGVATGKSGWSTAVLWHKL
ncbi:MAG: hypothetical protein ACTHM9_09900 [Gemmatimonadales bacterium]